MFFFFLSFFFSGKNRISSLNEKGADSNFQDAALLEALVPKIADANSPAVQVTVGREFEIYAYAIGFSSTNAARIWPWPRPSGDSMAFLFHLVSAYCKDAASFLIFGAVLSMKNGVIQEM